MQAYIERVLEEIRKKNATEPEFLQTVEEVYSSLEAVVNKHPEYEKASLLERMAEPERAISFRVSLGGRRGSCAGQPRLPRAV